MNTRTITTVAAFAAACLAGSAAYAGPSKPIKTVKEVAQESCITGDIGFDVVSNYVTKGIVQQNQGFIIQPYADLHFRIYKGAGALTSVTVDLGIWNSFQSNRPGIGGTTRNWYEFDFQAGLTWNFNKLAVGTYWKEYASPSDQFANCYAVGFNLGYDDSDVLGSFALHPYAVVELNVQGTTGNSRNGSRGQYYEVGIAPAHSWGNFTLSLPINAGFGSGGFYLGNRGFGFVGAGVKGTYALNCIPACLGKWSIYSGFNWYYLGGSNNPFTPSGAAGNDPAYTARVGTRTSSVAEKNELVFSGGLKVAF